VLTRTLVVLALVTPVASTVAQARPALEPEPAAVDEPELQLGISWELRIHSGLLPAVGFGSGATAWADWHSLRLGLGWLYSSSGARSVAGAPGLRVAGALLEAGLSLGWSLQLSGPLAIGVDVEAWLGRLQAAVSGSVPDHRERAWLGRAGGALSLAVMLEERRRVQLRASVGGSMLWLIPSFDVAGYGTIYQPRPVAVIAGLDLLGTFL
jgi:hypothetical protein